MEISGGMGDDRIDGSADPDEISGLEGDDHLYGHAQDDHLYGGEGNDMLAGGEGNDHLDGGADNDTLWGGEGADTAVFRDGYGHDVVMDFDPAEDHVLISSGGIEDWADLQARLSADHDGTAILTLDDGSTLRFEGVTVDELTQDNFTIDPPPVCFAAGSIIETASGPALVEKLTAGDLVMTLDNGLQPVLWMGRAPEASRSASPAWCPLAGSTSSPLPRRPRADGLLLRSSPIPVQSRWPKARHRLRPASCHGHRQFRARGVRRAAGWHRAPAASHVRSSW